MTIRLDHVTLRRGGRTVIQDLSGVFEPRSLTAITGPNGAGKSTLLHALAGSFPLSGGTISRDGTVALMAQEGRLDRSFPASCRDVVALGAAARLGLFRRIGPEELRAADAALDAVGMGGFGVRAIGALSAGQFQRVLFARTILRDARIILLDEPFSAVDAATEADLMDIVLDWHGQGRTIIAVLHDLDLIRADFPRTLLLGQPAPVWGPTGAILKPRKPRLIAVEAAA